MLGVRLPLGADLDQWRAAARPLLGADVAPDEILWSEGDGTPELFGSEASLPRPAAAMSISRMFVDLATEAILHRQAERFALLYRLAWRLRREPELMRVAVDPLVARLEDMAKAVRRDIHRMHAFVRFRRIEETDGERFVAWFEPEHHIVAAAAPFFRDRFAAMRWSIMTPDRCVAWDGEALQFAAGMTPPEGLHEGGVEELWRTYYAAIFNPARLKVKAMRSEMPRRYWRNLPEARLIEPLIASANARAGSMVAAAPVAPNAHPHRPAPRPEPVEDADPSDLGKVRAEGRDCRRCPLWKPATQIVFGEGPVDATLMLVGEQPGDQEDLQGRPFVGPAGQVLDSALAEAGIDRGEVYLTNAVKHFKFMSRGKRRIHQKPDAGEVTACRWWLSRELAVVRPRLVVAMGATAVQAVFGKSLAIGRNRGRPLPALGGFDVVITAHPSYILRIPDAESKERERAALVADLKVAGRLARQAASA